MKKKYLLIISLVLVILFFPIKFQYLDGGTTEYSALTYKIIKWNRIKNYGKIKTGTDVILFPNNFHSIDYYDHDIEPPELEVFTKGENEKHIICNTGTYHWSKKVDGKTMNVISDSTSPIEFNYQDKFIIKNTDKIYLTGLKNITEVEVKKLSDLENKYEITYNESTESFEFKSLTEGEYIVIFKYNKKKDYAYYAYKIEIIKE